MKKSDLKTGYRIRVRNGQDFVVMLNVPNRGDVAIEVGDTGWLDLDNYNKDLTRREHNDEESNYDIVEVFEARHVGAIIAQNPAATSLWKREESVPEYTMEELTTKLGHTFKIKK